MWTLGLTQKIAGERESWGLPWTEESKMRMRARARTSRLHGRSTCIVTSLPKLCHLHVNPTVRKCRRCSLSLLERVLKPQTLPRAHVIISWTNRERSTSKNQKDWKKKKKKGSQITIHTHYETAFLSQVWVFKSFVVCHLPVRNFFPLNQ